VNELFVYGTLRHGDVRWRFLAPYVADDGRTDSASGTLYDTGHGYPAARFDLPGVIVGHRYRLLPHRRDEALDVLDEIEGSVEGLYQRIEIITVAGVPAWSYEYGGPLDLPIIESGDWFRHRGG
jgi:gamma-glutamylcyclotransferase (GGCT)/AIG2-like uncharacterized protein YtfP